MKLLGRKNKKPSQQAYAVVTGAGSGIGRSFALELARRGGTVVCSDINLDAAKETVNLIEQLGATAFSVQCDVGKAEQVVKLAEQAEKLMQNPVTLVINNAGIGLGGKFDEMTIEDWQWCMDVNLWGVIHGCRTFVPKFKQLGHGAIINVASAASYTAAPEMTVYNVSKAGVRALSETLSAELKKFDIKVNVLCPTLVPTNIIKNGKVPHKGILDYALTNLAFTTSDKVAKLTLDRLDRNKLYTIPQIDAKLFWLMKRAAPNLYAKFLGTSYRLMK
ncbi:SDR family NAD(P)-dependent oxidoreductase [Acinetobacter sp. S40]|uniref:SDR family NAD(P)-dependent oxidoreductase n=1 Tax=unclassified Acinetobacter TaxID=196816 RepID=UPI00190CBE35|nr:MULTISPECIES: SDR family NAD(P)-dependent oxidoreductase [unclassified Acinetobacter]MBJ9985339.1 SDR family NAD(P)-dependent oxidoreductase [Acinetobacter sp. S40]MBK0063901.1 SDR family NAD(P)-dependent oxidoreductase [Acinetobacter sp. S55]MBK0067031.1 SDR family NAD(P)-dependent oxidoreductase [Acinetobacter sp. S54]